MKSKVWVATRLFVIGLIIGGALMAEGGARYDLRLVDWTLATITLISPTIVYLAVESIIWLRTQQRRK